jgi:hypothetical protein
MAISLEDSKNGTINQRLCLRKHGGKAGNKLKKLAEITQLISGKTEHGFWVSAELQIQGIGPALLRGDCIKARIRGGLATWPGRGYSPRPGSDCNQDSGSQTESG